MAFLEGVRFPDNIAYWASGGAGFNTSIVTLNSGFEQRNVNWAQSRGRWDISNGLRSQADIAQAIAFFRGVQGKANGFRFKDFNDFSVTTVDGLFIATTVTGRMQAVKVYTINGSSPSMGHVRTIKKPTSVFQLYKLGVLQSYPTNYALDLSQGWVTPVAFSNLNDYTWVGEFDVPVRFDTDHMVGHREAQGGFYEWSSIPLVEIRI